MGCWSVGTQDLDCKESALCCFDGCANRCLGEGPIDNNGKTEPLTLLSEKNENNGIATAEVNFSQVEIVKPNINQVNQEVYDGNLGSDRVGEESTDNTEELHKSEATNIYNSITNQIQTAEKFPKQKPSSIIYFPGEETNDQNNTAVQSANIENLALPTPVFQETNGDEANFISQNEDLDPSFPRKSSKENTKDKLVDFVKSGLSKQYIAKEDLSVQKINANTKVATEDEIQPWVTCPSAMKCVQRSFCDLNGVMVQEEINYTPELKSRQVQLIACLNNERGYSVDVCCRDPNYKDSWPQMEGQESEVTGKGSSVRETEQLQREPTREPTSSARPTTANTVNLRRHSSNAYGK